MGAQGKVRLGRSGLLPEIEGLRAVAVLSVLLFHARLGFSGGYVGVDVFFVVSGFLITGLLLREYGETGRVSLREFYARRVRRLLPAAVLVLLVTLVLVDRFLDPIRAGRNAVDTLYAAGFVANFRFAVSGADYFQQALAPSVLQHWWSLAVEEQFYLVWPGLLSVTWWLCARSRRGWCVRWGAFVVVVAVGVASFVVGWRLTSGSPSWGYFATWSRGWELAVGAACAFLWVYRDRVRALAVRSVLGWVGIALIVYAALRFDGGTPFPGTAAWFPVAGTVLVIASIGMRWGPGVVLSLRPLQWVGGRSYGIYLWHWPLLVVLEARVDGVGAGARAGMLVVSVGLAALSYVLVENPVRHQRVLVASAWKSLATGCVLTGVVLVGGVVARGFADDIGGTGYVAPTVVPTTLPVTVAPVTVAPVAGSTVVDSTVAVVTSPSPPVSPSSLEPTTTSGPLDELDRRVATELQPLIAASLENDLLPDNLRPPLTKAAKDRNALTRNGCLLNYERTRNPECAFGNTGSDTHLLMFGDSHTAQWFPAIEAIAKRRGWKLTAWAKSGCPSVDVHVARFDKPTYVECDRWQKDTLARILKTDADLVILSNFRYRGSDVRMSSEVWRAGLERVVKALVEGGKKVLVLIDAPAPDINQVDCLASHRQRIQKCTRSRESSTRPAIAQVEVEVAAQYGAMSYDPTDWFCTDACPAVIGDMVVRFDRDHITRTYAEFLVPYLEPVLVTALTGPAAP